MNEEIRVLDHGFVRLDGALADDLSVVNSARVSLDIRHEVLEEGDEGLIKFLMRERHGTPFEHNAFRFHVKLPIFVAREWMRHRIGSFNEMSGRYKRFENPDFYIPDNLRTQVGKPGSYSFEQWTGNGKMFKNQVLRHCQDSMDLYNHYVDNGLAKELARIVIPVNLYTQFYWTLNARSLMNFLSLRNAPQALWEIQEYAKVVEEIAADLMPITFEAFVSNNRTSP